MKVLLVEDDAFLSGMLCQELGSINYVIEAVGNNALATYHLAHGEFELLLIDRLLPDGDGLELVSPYRASGGAAGVIVITARRSVEERVEALECGADDVLPKPFALGELRARIRALRRRPRTWQPEIYKVGDLVIDCERQLVDVQGVTVNLTPKELLVLRLLARNPGRLLSRGQLVRQVWDQDHEPDAHSLEVHVSNMRVKLSAAGSDVRIAARRGAGYQLVDRATGVALGH